MHSHRTEAARGGSSSPSCAARLPTPSGSSQRQRRDPAAKVWSRSPAARRRTGRSIRSRAAAAASRSGMVAAADDDRDADAAPTISAGAASFGALPAPPAASSARTYPSALTRLEVSREVGTDKAAKRRRGDAQASSSSSSMRFKCLHQTDLGVLVLPYT